MAVSRRALIRGELVEQGAVVAGIDDHRDRGVILGGGAHHRRAADVDILDGVVVAAVGARHGGRKWIEIHDEQIDGLDAVLAHHVLVETAAPQQTAVDLRVKSLHPAAHDLGKARVLRDFLHRDAVPHQELCRAARREQLDAALLECARKLDDSSLIGNAEQCATDGREQCYPTR